MGFTPNLRGLKSLMRCDGLEKLAISIPAGDIVSFAQFYRNMKAGHGPQYSFTSVLTASTSLHTLIDMVNHGTCGKRMSLTTDRVKPLLELVPSLTRVVSENRLWTVRAG
jgi:hypothetical protein